MKYSAVVGILLAYSHLSLADNVVDESALIQSLKVSSHRVDVDHVADALQSKSTRRAYLTGLLERTEDLAKAGVTPEVVVFVRAAITDIEETLMPILQREHNSDQKILDDLFAAFDKVETDFQTGLVDVLANIETRTQLHTEHRQCRTDESELCNIANECEAELSELWKDVVDLEERLVDTDIAIYEIWCESEANRTLAGFRTETVTHFDEYITTKKLLDEAWELYLEKLEECQKKRKAHHDKIPLCDETQTNLEVGACSHAITADSLRTIYESAFSQATDAYNAADRSIKIEEADRKVEHSTLEMILCLLRNIDELVNGSAAAAGTDFAAHLEACHEDIYDTAYLDITYYQVPDMSDLPTVPTFPCTTDYTEEEYADMPFCTTPGECQQCSGMRQCAFAACTKDLCADGRGRRQIGDDCCACPQLDHKDTIGDEEEWP